MYQEKWLRPTPNETAKDFINKYAESKGYKLPKPQIDNGIHRYDINGGAKNGGRQFYIDQREMLAERQLL